MTQFMNKAARPGGEVLLAGRPVARVGYGVMQLADRPGRAPLPAEEAIALLRRAVELGVNHFDTAQFYGAGLANDLIRSALAPYDDDIVLVSKIGADHVDAPVPLKPAQKPEELRASVEDNLASLGVEQLAVVNLRRLDIQPGLLATGDQVVSLDDQLAELVALRAEGKVEAIGLSNIRLDQLQQALPAGIACVQNAYSLLERSGEPLLDLCGREGIAWAPFFPLGSAFPGRPKVTDQAAVKATARALGVTPSQVGLAWLLQHAPNILLIPGTSSVDHLRENVAAAEIAIPAEMIAHLEADPGSA
ncbi:MAG: aldo/keto reductase [Actinomycetota bacterium]|nr:aldo/keto reductase [Actinomycetota bacterium]